MAIPWIMRVLNWCVLLSGRLPRRLSAPRNDAAVVSWPFCFGGSVVQPGRWGHDPTLQGEVCIFLPDICKNPLTTREKCAMLTEYKAVMKTRPGG